MQILRLSVLEVRVRVRKQRILSPQVRRKVDGARGNVEGYIYKSYNDTCRMRSTLTPGHCKTSPTLRNSCSCSLLLLPAIFAAFALCWSLPFLFFAAYAVSLFFFSFALLARCFAFFAAAAYRTAPTRGEHGAGGVADGVHLPRDALRVHPRSQHDRQHRHKHHVRAVLLLVAVVAVLGCWLVLVLVVVVWCWY